MMKKLLVAFAVLLAAISWSMASTAQQNSGYVVIVHSTNSVASISKGQASQYLLKKKSSWPDGAAVLPVDQTGDSPVREALSRDLHGRSVASIKVFWQRQIFSGRNTPPPEVDDDSSMVDYVKSRPGAIGYVSASTTLSGVKRIAITN